MGKYLDLAGVAHLADKVDERFTRQAIIADQFSPSIPYAIGAYCLRGGVLYKATAPHEGEWSDSDFQADTVGAEVRTATSGAEAAKQTAENARDLKAGLLVSVVNGGSVALVPDPTITSLLGLTIELAPSQSGSGDPSPTNVRPLVGITSVAVNVSGADTGDSETVTLSWDDSYGNVYAGLVDVVGGKLFARPHYASYNGETLVGPWLSSMDVYAAGTTPTTGAEVVDLGGALTEVDVTPTPVRVTTGETNNISTASGTMTITYAADVKTYIDEAIAAAVASMS